MRVPWGCDSIRVEISRVTGVGVTVCRGKGVSVHHNLSRLICVHGRGCCHGGGPYKSSATAPSSGGLLGTLRFWPACRSAAGGRPSHQCHKESGENDYVNGRHTEGSTQKREEWKSMSKKGAAV